MKTIARTALLLVTLGGASSLFAEPQIYGIGVKSCGDYVDTSAALRDGKQEQMLEMHNFISWFIGFASAISVGTGEDVLHDTSAEAMTVWFEEYCAANPAEPFAIAGVELLNSLRQP